MDQRADSPDARYARPKPRPYARPRPSLSRYLLATATAAVIAALALWGGLWTQMSAGKDPVLGDKAVVSTSVAAPISTDDSDDESDEIDTEESEDEGVVVVAQPQTPAPVVAQAPTPTPVQTTTS
jgi:hypothetical protein